MSWQAVLIEDGDHATASVEVDPGGFEARGVVVGHTAGEHAQIVSGLNPGERVAVAGALLLDQRSGAALRYMSLRECSHGHVRWSMSMRTCYSRHVSS